MRYVVWGPGLALLALASCTPSKPPPATVEVKNQAHAVILTIRPVPVGDPRTAGLLNAGTDRASSGSAEYLGSAEYPGSAEYIVRTDDGATLAIVQAADPGLRPGADVIISRGERATLAIR